MQRSKSLLPPSAEAVLDGAVSTRIDGISLASFPSVVSRCGEENNSEFINVSMAWVVDESNGDEGGEGVF
jgi:hypothetical protein